MFGSILHLHYVINIHFNPSVVQLLAARRLEPEQKQPAPVSRDDPCPLASVDTARLQAWNRRIAPLLSEKHNLSPISRRIKIRTEFSGAGTAEESMAAAAGIFNDSCSSQLDHIKVQCESVGDWSKSARYVCSLNHPTTCRFGDIMMMAPTTLKNRLQELLNEKALDVLCFEEHALLMPIGLDCLCSNLQCVFALTIMIIPLFMEVTISSDDIKAAVGFDKKDFSKNDIKKAVDGLFLKGGSFD